MKLPGSRILAILLFLFTAGQLISGPLQNSVPISRAEKIQEEKKAVMVLLRSPYYRRLFKSFAVGVIQDGRLVYSGYENSDPEKLYGTASVTKMFTTTAILQLVEEGNLSLDDRVSDLIPGLVIEREDLHSRPVRVIHLLSHTAGFPDLRFYRKAGWQSVPDSKYRIPRQIYPAGTHYRYANHGFILLGLILERKTGMTLQKYFHTKIFQPLGMEHTTTSHWLSGAGGVKTTLPDLARFAAMYVEKGKTNQGKRILSEASLKKITALHSYLKPANSIEYCGLGWRIRRVNGEVRQIFHIGGANQVAAWVQIFPPSHTAVVYLGDPPDYEGNVMEFLTVLQQRLGNLATAFADEMEPVWDFSPALPEPGTLDRFQGIYARRPDMKFLRLESRENTLLMQDFEGSEPEKPGTVLYPAGVLKFRGGSQYISHDFLENEEGEIRAFVREDGFYDRVSSEPDWKLLLPGNKDSS